MAGKELTMDYNEFDADWYLRTYYECPLDEVEYDDFLPFVLDSLDAAFKTGKITGGRLLDVGTGPTIHSVLGASRHVNEICLSDFAAQNRKLLCDWWKSDKLMEVGITEYVIKTEMLSESVSNRQNTLKQKITAILPIDVHSEHPLGEASVDSTFDIVLSSLCFEVASKSLKEYRKALENVSTMLKPGGLLILVGLCGQSYYRVAKKEFSSLPLHRNDVIDAIEQLGYTLLSMRLIRTEDSVFSDTKEAFVLVAQKNK